jgi:hypothetical protein
MTDRDAIRDAAFVAAIWNVHSDELRQLLERDLEAGLEGFIQAIRLEDSRVFVMDQYLDLFPMTALEAAGAPEHVLDRKRMLAEFERRQAREATTTEEVGETLAEAKVGLPIEPEEARRPPTLSDLLARDREHWDEIIAHHSQHYAGEVASLSPEEADDLRHRLDEWWPERPFAETITRTNANSWTQENLAAAWLWFGPPLDKDMTPHQWAELASSGILFHDQIEWLQRKASTEAKLELARTCRAGDSRVWYEALSATPDPLPDELVKAIVTNLKAAEDKHYNVSYIGERLYSGAGTAPLEALSRVSEHFANALRPLLAAAGDEDAQRFLVRQLREQLEAHQRPDRENLRWLDAVENEDLLDDLFACVEILWTRPAGIDVGRGWHSADAATPVMNAIRNIGGRGAVERYDRLIARNQGLQFLLSQREAIAQAMLRHNGLVAAEEAARQFGLPVFVARGAGPENH